jgi:hypothetical protein
MTLILVLSLGYCCKSGVLLLCCAVTVTDNITQKEIVRQGGRDTNAWMNTEKCDSRCRYPTGRNGGAREQGGGCGALVLDARNACRSWDLAFFRGSHLCFLVWVEAESRTRKWTTLILKWKVVGIYCGKEMDGDDKKHRRQPEVLAARMR